MKTLICNFHSTPIILLSIFITFVCFIYQQWRTNKVTRADMWLKLETMFSTSRREHVHLAIMDKKYPKENFMDTDDSYWVDDYLGIFELCYIMIEKGIIDISTFKAVYRYRLIYFLQYELLVKEKLIKEGHYYETLYKLFSKCSENKYWNKYWNEKIKDKTEEERKNEKSNSNLYEELKEDLIIPFLRKENVSTKIDNTPPSFGQGSNLGRTIR
jgi:hypothetical protein